MIRRSHRATPRRPDVPAIVHDKGPLAGDNIRLTGGQLVARALKRHGIETVFGLAGTTHAHILEARRAGRGASFRREFVLLGTASLAGARPGFLDRCSRGDMD